jgi:hypothetical protein
MADPKDPKGPKPSAPKEETGVDEQAVKVAQRLLETKRETAAQQEEYVKKLQEDLEIMQKTAVTAKDQKDLSEKNLEIVDEIYELKKKQLKEEKASGKLSEEEYFLSLKAAKEEREHLKRLEKEKELQGGLLKTLGQSFSTLSGFSAIQSKIGEGFGFIGASTAVLLEKVGKMAEEMQELSMASAQAGVAMGDAYSFFGGGQMSQLTGLARDANGEMRTMTEFGVGFKELAESQNELRMSMTSFSDQTSTNRNLLAANAAQMKNLGVSVGESGKNYNFLIKSLQMTGKEAAAATDKLAKTAIAAGIPVKNMLRDFAQIGPQLAAQGPKATEIFSNLAKQAKSLGVEVSTLMGAFGQAMDTFEGAANAAGKFNAVMGGDYLNAMELLNATEDQRVDIVKRQMDATGKNFATMSKYEKIAVANALGIKDVNEAQMILAGSTEEMRKKKEQEAASQEKLNQLQSEAVSILTKLSSAFQVVFAIVGPVFEIFSFLANVLVKINDKLLGIPAIVAAGYLLSKSFAFLRARTEQLRQSKIMTIRTSVQAQMAFAKEERRLKALSDRLKAGAAATKGMTKAQIEMAKAYDKANAGPGKLKGGFMVFMELLPFIIMLFQMLHDVLLEPNSPILMDTLTTTLPMALEGIGRALEPLIKPMLAFGAAMLMIGGGIFLAAYGVAALVKAFMGLNGPQILGAVAAITVFSAAIVLIVAILAELALTGVGELAAGILIALGAGFLMIGAGVFLAAHGMATFVEKIGELGSKGIVAGTSLALIGAGVLMLSASIAVLTASLLGLMVLGASGPIGFLALAAGVAMATAAIYALGKAFETFPTEKSISFTASTDSLAKTLAMVKEVKSEDVKPTIEVMKAAQEYMIVSSIAKMFKGEDPAVKLLQKILEVANVGVNKAGGGKGEKEEYKIMIDSDVFGTLVKKATSGSGMNEKTAVALSK